MPRKRPLPAQLDSLRAFRSLLHSPTLIAQGVSNMKPANAEYKYKKYSIDMYTLEYGEIKYSTFTMDRVDYSKTDTESRTCLALPKMYPSKLLLCLHVPATTVPRR